MNGKKKHPRLDSPRLLRKIRSRVSRLSAEAAGAAEDIAKLPEPAMKEFKSADRLEQFLRRHAFRVDRPWRGIPTAFRARMGSGRPAVAILAEYDALPDCGDRPGEYGHGCGHNLVGTGAALAGIVAGQTMNEAGIPGSVLVIGTPAEEIISGKIFLAAQGAFSGLDAVLLWHPGVKTGVGIGGGAAMDSIRFRFLGRSAHAATMPQEGRSALDAVMLMDVAVNFLREHVEDNVRIHAVVTEGGKAPNVVPDRSEIWYYLRGRDRGQVDELRRRVVCCARGAAMATGTRCHVIITDSLTEQVPNRALGETLDAVLRRCGAPRFTSADGRAARRVSKGKRYSARIEPMSTESGKASNDAANVSWLVPLGRLGVACVPNGTITHHREYAAMVRIPGAHRGMCKAAEVLAATVVELAVNRSLLKKVKAEFRRNRRGKRHHLPMATSVAALKKRVAEAYRR